MRSIVRKFAVGAALAGSALLINPFNHADAAPRAEFRKCANQAQNARDRAGNQFRRALRDARQLPDTQQQAAVQAAQSAFRQAIQQAQSQFQSCVEGIDTGA